MANAELTAGRWHELALTNWFNQHFFVEEGYPIPVLFSSPMDAYGYFENLWARENNPFRYLLDAKDESGTPLYLPHPAKPAYPIISVHKKGWTFRPSQNYSTRKFKRRVWPTKNDDVLLKDLAEVEVSRMPMAWDFKYQIDFFCLRPDTQANFVMKLMNEFWMGGGGLQTWLTVKYPKPWDQKRVRLRFDGDSVDNLTPEEPGAEMTIYRTSFSLVIEGYTPDIYPKYIPTFWQLELRNTIPSDPMTLAAYFETEEDLRPTVRNPEIENSVVKDRIDDLPPLV
jgi:hypothetical protein